MSEGDLAAAILGYSGELEVAVRQPLRVQLSITGEHDGLAPTTDPVGDVTMLLLLDEVLDILVTHLERSKPRGHVL